MMCLRRKTVMNVREKAMAIINASLIASFSSTFQKRKARRPSIARMIAAPIKSHGILRAS